MDDKKLVSIWLKHNDEQFDHVLQLQGVVGPDSVVHVVGERDDLETIIHAITTTLEDGYDQSESREEGP